MRQRQANEIARPAVSTSRASANTLVGALPSSPPTRDRSNSMDPNINSYSVSRPQPFPHLDQVRQPYVLGHDGQFLTVSEGHWNPHVTPQSIPLPMPRYSQPMAASSYPAVSQAHINPSALAFPQIPYSSPSWHGQSALTIRRKLQVVEIPFRQLHL